MTRQRILGAARRLLVTGTHHSSVTMEDIAKEAGVALPRPCRRFAGSKPGLAHGLVEVGFPHVDDALKLFNDLRASADVELWLRTGAHVNRLIYEICADLLRFMRESGDPSLLARYRERQEQVFSGRDDPVWPSGDFGTQQPAARRYYTGGGGSRSLVVERPGPVRRAGLPARLDHHPL